MNNKDKIIWSQEDLEKRCVGQVVLVENLFVNNYQDYAKENSLKEKDENA